MLIWLLLPHTCRQLSFWRDSTNLFSWSRGAAHTVLFLQGLGPNGGGKGRAMSNHKSSGSPISMWLFSVVFGKSGLHGVTPTAVPIVESSRVI